MSLSEKFTYDLFNKKLKEEYDEIYNIEKKFIKKCEDDINHRIEERDKVLKNILLEEIKKIEYYILQINNSKKLIKTCKEIIKDDFQEI